MFDFGGQTEPRGSGQRWLDQVAQDLGWTNHVLVVHRSLFLGRSGGCRGMDAAWQKDPMFQELAKAVPEILLSGKADRLRSMLACSIDGSYVWSQGRRSRVSLRRRLMSFSTCNI